MHILGHSATALPFLAMGSYEGALGAVLPDITWVYAEYKYRTSGIKSWHKWAETSITDSLAMPYRIAHSLLFVVPICLWFKWYAFLLGWAIHIALDLPTHSGVMQQRPLYPLSWRWKWIIQRFC